MELWDTKQAGYRGPRVYAGFAVEWGDNGETGDAKVRLMVAPVVDKMADLAVYLETNGDPVMVGMVDRCGILLWDDVGEWADHPDYAWVWEALDGEGIEVDPEE